MAAPDSPLVIFLSLKFAFLLPKTLLLAKNLFGSEQKYSKVSFYPLGSIFFDSVLV